MQFSDEELVEKVLKGEQRAFEVLVNRWQRQIYGLALRILGREDDAYDVCQETFLLAYRNLSKFRGEAKFSSWLYRIAINCCHTVMRTRGNNLSLECQREEVGYEPSVESDFLDEAMQKAQLSKIVRRALMGLPAEMREVIVMKEYQQMKFHEIAEVLGIPVSTVKTRLYTGLEQLRQRLSHIKGAL
ncbi:MAG: sigma-70 family RNA polymerase sigma factor [Acidobacteriota bacterium]|nr:sigma-70 family RNA polymerase sigma factor [Blastocatellia bacterium]MDW8411639.1 sigma-70 family RNA polymerase sigma factor [Acidobacteriota bacterium]